MTRRRLKYRNILEIGPFDYAQGKLDLITLRKVEGVSTETFRWQLYIFIFFLKLAGNSKNKEGIIQFSFYFLSSIII